VTTVPVLWIVGANDPLVQASASESTFNMIPTNAKSRFVLLVGRDHSTSLPASSELLIAWMKTLMTN
jgi:pimeloyl-ACP methyl ester carboxylesterase